MLLLLAFWMIFKDCALLSMDFDCPHPHTICCYSWLSGWFLRIVHCSVWTLTAPPPHYMLLTLAFWILILRIVYCLVWTLTAPTSTLYVANLGFLNTDFKDCALLNMDFDRTRWNQSYTLPLGMFWTVNIRAFLYTVLNVALITYLEALCTSWHYF